jgi:hypothetical protein
LEMNSFFTLHSFLEVGKTQDLTSKFWQTVGDALMTLDLPCAASPCMLLVDDFHYFFFLTYLLYIYMLLVQGSSTKPLRHMHHASKIPIYLIIS